MKVAVTGTTGRVGGFVAQGVLRMDAELLPLNRPDYHLGDAPDLSGCHALVHCAFQHVPGLYRSGEGDDPERFVRDNHLGSITLFKAAKAARLSRVIFLSTRAVYGIYPAGTVLSEDLTPNPDTLYGQVKWQTEQDLAALNSATFSTASIRATGIYGPGPHNKWRALFNDFQSHRPIASRRGTEVHGADLASAVNLLLTSAANGPFNVSDILLDRHDLLSKVAHLTGTPHSPPPRSNDVVNVMTCERLLDLGWKPRGVDGLVACLPELIEPQT
ncbi:MAG: SDR family oxidoreductase [Pelagimonas sp.]